MTKMWKEFAKFYNFIHEVQCIEYMIDGAIQLMHKEMLEWV